jgi:hypothetical protein
MALGDFTILREASFGVPGSRKHAVAAGAVASIKAGELVLKTPGDASVLVWTASNTAKPVVGTDYIAGLSATISTDTAAAAGSVEIIPITPGMVLLGTPTTPATFGTATTGVLTQATYDALVGDRVLLRTSAAGVQTVEPTDGATYGLVIQPLDIVRYPGKVAISINPNIDYLTKNS